MLNLDEIYLFRMTHIENIPHILKYGITHKNSKNANSQFVPIGDNTLINTRKDFVLENGKILGDYIPFYFYFKMPMLYVIQNGHNGVMPTTSENIVYCISSVQKIIDLKLDFVFTNGHASNKLTNQYTIDDIQNIGEHLDFIAIKALYWKSETDLDLKRRKEAEFLVLNDIAMEGIVAFAVANQSSQQKLISFGIDNKKIAIRPNYYF